MKTRIECIAEMHRQYENVTLPIYKVIDESYLRIPLVVNAWRDFEVFPVERTLFQWISNSV